MTNSKSHLFRKHVPQFTAVARIEYVSSHNMIHKEINLSSFLHLLKSKLLD